MVFDDILYDQPPLVVLLLLNLERFQLPGQFQQVHDFADVIPLVVVVLVLFRDYKRKRLVIALHAKPEIQERQVEIEQYLQALIELVVQIKRVDEGQHLHWPLVRSHESVRVVAFSSVELEILEVRAGLSPGIEKHVRAALFKKLVRGVLLGLSLFFEKARSRR